MRLFLIDARRGTIATQVYGGTETHLKKILGTTGSLDVVELADGNCFVAPDEDDDADEGDPHFFFSDWELPHYQSAAIVGPALSDKSFGEVGMTKAELERLIQWGA